MINYLYFNYKVYLNNGIGLNIINIFKNISKKYKLSKVFKIEHVKHVIILTY